MKQIGMKPPLHGDVNEHIHLYERGRNEKRTTVEKREPNESVAVMQRVENVFRGSSFVHSSV